MMTERQESDETQIRLCAENLVLRGFPEEHRTRYLVIGTKDVRDNDRIRAACDAAWAAVLPRPLM